jgi:predicted aldo/keto reductase-like oxidoreductase
MRYTQLGRTGLRVGVVGLGMEHLQSADPQVVLPVVNAALHAGANSIDIMLWLPEPQALLGQAIRGRRDKVVLAGHLGVAEENGQYRKTRNIAECVSLFEGLLQRLGTDHVDVLHLTFVDEPAEYEQVTGPGGILELALQYKAQGKVHFLGMSGHNPVVAMRAVESGLIDVLMQPVFIGQARDPNMAGADPTAATELGHLCASRGVALVAMKTFGGGQLLHRDKPLAPALCLHHTLSQPGVCVAALGIKTVDEWQADLHYLDATDEEKDFTPLLQELQVPAGTCVYCNHCLPCPVVIDIPAVNRLLAAGEHGVSPALRQAYRALEAQASTCVECGDCMERCPFGVDVIAHMRRAVAMFEG